MKGQSPSVQNVNVVTKQDIEKIFTMDAVLTSKFFITTQSDGTVRICFADADPSGEFMFPRFTAVMSLNSFASFAQLIGENMQNIAKMRSDRAGTPTN